MSQIRWKAEASEEATAASRVVGRGEIEGNNAKVTLAGGLYVCSIHEKPCLSFRQNDKGEIENIKLLAAGAEQLADLFMELVD